MWQWLEELKTRRKMKGTIKTGLEVMHAVLGRDYDRLAELLPEFTAYIEQQTIAAVQSPINREFEYTVNQAAIQQLPDLEPVEVEPDDIASMYDDMEI